jgi:hypothetical protein
MFPPIFAVCSIVPAVTALIGASPVRLYPFGDAPQAVALPYVTWQTITGLPENYIDRVPDIDSYTLQVDCYATTATSARNVAKAIRDAIETKAHIVAWRGESKDPDTLHYRSSFDVTWFVPR